MSFAKTQELRRKTMIEREQRIWNEAMRIASESVKACLENGVTRLTTEEITKFVRETPMPEELKKELYA